MSKEPKFEDAMGELEKLVTQLEQGELSLEDSLKAYEKGSSLVKQCQQKLAAAEMRVEKIMSSQGDITTEPLE